MLDSLWLYPILFLTGLMAGLIDSIAGGGGLIALPVLLGAGLSPQVALGTNKFQSMFGTFTASHHFVDKGLVNLDDTKRGILFTFIGAAAGTLTVQQINPGILDQIIPFLLAAIVVYAFFTPDLGKIDKHARMSRELFYPLAGFTMGFYDGFFGPGAGAFWTIIFVAGLGFSLAKATGYTKVMNFTSNVVAVALFAIGGHIRFSLGLAMAAGQIIGARLGSGIVIRRGSSFIKPIYFTIVGLTILKLFYDRFF